MNNTSVSILILVVGLLIEAAVVCGIAIITRRTDNPSTPEPEPDEPETFDAHADDAITLTALQSQLFTADEVAELRRIVAADRRGVA